MRPSTMRVRVLFFGQLKETAGFGEQWMEMFEGDSVGDLLAIVRTMNVVPARLLQACAVAVNREYSNAARSLRTGDEVAILPPVSGGLS